MSSGPPHPPPSSRSPPAPVDRTADAIDERWWQQALDLAGHRRELALAAAAGSPDRARHGTDALDRLMLEAAGDPERSLLGLYRPLLAVAPGQRQVVAHLGQSIDGCIATRDGSSRGLNGHENLVHLHRMRALSDAIVVGAGTVLADDPQLTTRLVTGPSPVRVVLDRRGRVDSHHGICRDGKAPTLILTGAAGSTEGRPGPAAATTAGRLGSPGGRRFIGQAEVVELPVHGDSLSPGAVLECLARRGLAVVFVEGGGITVSRFLAAGCLDRLQVTIAPVLFGCGVRGLDFDLVTCVEQAVRPPARQFALGDDHLWDFDLAAGAQVGAQVGAGAGAQAGAQAGGRPTRS